MVGGVAVFYIYQCSVETIGHNGPAIIGCCSSYYCGPYLRNKINSFIEGKLLDRS